MSTLTHCPVCHHAIPDSALAFCAACGAPRAAVGPAANALETWAGWTALAAAQEAVGSYWFMARRDYAQLRQHAETWTAPHDPARRLLSAKLDRALVGDGDQFPRDVVSIGSHVEFRFRGEITRLVLADPARTAPAADALSVLSPLGALLLGMIERRPLRGQDPDGGSFALMVEKVEQPASLRGAVSGEATQRKRAS